MTIPTVITKEEQNLIEGMLDPVAFFDVFAPQAHKEVECARDYQVESLLDTGQQAITKAGRGVGKTVMVESDIFRVMHANPGREGLLTTPNKAHIEPLWNRMTNFVSSDEYWNQFIVRKVKSDTYTMEAANGFVLHGRISGTSKGTGLLSLHVDFAWIDEAQLYCGLGLDQLQGCFKDNCRIRIYGVPNGMRKGYLSIAYNDPSIPADSKHKITRLQDPTFTQKEDDRLQRIYGGKHSQQYLNQVLAEEGTATQKTFNPVVFNRCFVQTPEYEVFEYDGRKMKESDLNEDKLILDIPPEAVQVDISGDLGFHPDPTVIGIWITDNSRTVLHKKIMLYNITYTRQARFLNTIAELVRARNVAVDIGGPGQTVYLDLNNQTLYPNKSYNILPVDFRASLPVAAAKDGTIIKENAKCHATMLIGRAFEEKTILLPSQDLMLYDEVDSSTQYRTNRGTYTYVGVDHHLDMMRCFVLTKILSKEITVSSGPLIGYSDF